jgi:hypothetical protein
VFHNGHYGIHVTGGAGRAVISGATEITPLGGAVNFIITDVGTTAVVSGITKITADSLAAGTTNVDGSA